ncbi:hypothetical protein [Methylobrevis pamukkalensis]|nr:hypothetical protein [Methylobrevis pamukkalensis]
MPVVLLLLEGARLMAQAGQGVAAAITDARAAASCLIAGAVAR